MARPEEDQLPDSGDIIAGLEEMLKGGGKLFGDRPILPEPAKETSAPPSGKDEKFYMEGFFTARFPKQIPVDSPRLEAQNLYRSSPILKGF